MCKCGNSVVSGHFGLFELKSITKLSSIDTGTSEVFGVKGGDILVFLLTMKCTNNLYCSYFMECDSDIYQLGVILSIVIFILLQLLQRDNMTRGLPRFC